MLDLRDIEFIIEVGYFKEIIFTILENHTHPQIFISGMWSQPLYKDILEQIINNNYAQKSKIILPHMLQQDAIIPKIFMNKFHKSGGQIRIHSDFNKSLLIIGDYAFVASFSHRFNKKDNLNLSFECGVFTSCSDTVKTMKDAFVNAWKNSLSLIYEDFRGEMYENNYYWRRQGRL